MNNMPRERRLGNKEIDSFDWGAFDVDDAEMGDYITAQWGIEKLKQDHDKPFFLGVGIYRPHIPLFVPQKYYDLFPPDKVILPPVLADDLDDLPQVAKDLALKAYSGASHQNVIDHGQWKEAVAHYLACIAFADAQVWRVLDALNKSPYRDNTSIVLLSDHGFHLGEKEHWGKFAGWKESTRVPLIIVPSKNRSKEFALNSKCNSPVSLVDLYPTVLELLNLDQTHALDGKSLVPLLKDPKAESSGFSISTFGRGNHSINTNNWNYIHYYDGNEELYDLNNDPNEYNNLASKIKFEAVLNTFRQKLPAYSDVAHFISMDYWKAVVYNNPAKNELFNFQDNKALSEDKNVAAEHPEVIESMRRYIKDKKLSGKYISIPELQQ